MVFVKLANDFKCISLIFQYDNIKLIQFIIIYKVVFMIVANKWNKINYL